MTENLMTENLVYLCFVDLLRKIAIVNFRVDIFISVHRKEIKCFAPGPYLEIHKTVRARIYTCKN